MVRMRYCTRSALGMRTSKCSSQNVRTILRMCNDGRMNLSCKSENLESKRYRELRLFHGSISKVYS